MNVEELAKLAGMKYCSYSYTAEEWVAKTGVDPRTFKEIDIRENGLCGWTKRAEELYQQRHTTTHNNWTALGVNHVL